jgi:DNA-binding MarR family transcriptional regulator
MGCASAAIWRRAHVRLHRTTNRSPRIVKKEQTDPSSPSVKKVRLRLSEQAERNVQKYHGLKASTIVVLLAIYRLGALMDRYQKDELASTGLNALEFNALMVLNEVEEPISMGDFGSMIAVRPTNLSAVIGSLQKKKYVKQALNEADRRSRIIGITKAGSKFMDKFLPEYLSRLDAVMTDNMNMEDLDALLRGLRQLGANLEKRVNF